MRTVIRNSRPVLALLFAAGLALVTFRPAPVAADPCGMVPPITIGIPDPITRSGDQITYVFYKDGIESFLIRPGFTGKVEEFGMLIPFPTPPAIRKSADDAFSHIAAAVDPPEVVIDLRIRYRGGFGGGGPAGAARNMRADALSVMEKQEVRVLREEAVGMYEVAVLDAGSAEALSKWMTDHGYRYPEGMDKVCEEYVADGWCFVAVKSKVAPKGSVDPKPGMREVNSGLPNGSSFDGHVQGMAFRFYTDELVVPMRLSSFNKGELRNIVYLLTDSPRKIRAIPEEYVVRQVRGEELLSHVTEPLPLRVIGGTEKDIPDYQRQSLPTMRDPTPQNGIAKILFASDLLAVADKRLSHPFEDTEKMLLRIGESLSLRGPEIDRVNHMALTVQREGALARSIGNISDMTLTVVDGDFPREVLAGSNLRFVDYSMPAQRNKPALYDAKVRGPAPKNEGELYFGALPPRDAEPIAANAPSGSGLALLAGLGLGLLGLTLARSRRKSAIVVAILGLALSGATYGTSVARSQETQRQGQQADEATIKKLIEQFADPEKVDSAVEEMLKIGKPAVPHLAGEALEGEELVRRGWAIQCMAKIGGPEADKYLAQIVADANQPELVRTWAVAGRVAIAGSVSELVDLAQYVSTYPAVGRPIGMRLVAALDNPVNPPQAQDVIAITVRVPELMQTLAPTIMGFGVDSLVKVMTNADDQQVRNTAAAFLGTLAQQGNKEVAPAVVNVYKFNKDAKAVPWNGGPLWIPGIQWDKENAQSLVDNLIRWHLWCDLHDKNEEKQQIHNNIRSVQLAGVVGYENPGWQDVDTDRWLQVWGNLVGQAALRQLLEEQGAADNAKYKAILAAAPKK